jgi:hypothetical protein
VLIILTSFNQYRYVGGCPYRPYTRGVASLPNNLTTIPDFAFYNCKSLKSILIPQSVAKIGSSAFQGTSLSSISLPSYVVSVGQDAFADCPNLTTAVYYFGTSIGSNAFDNTGYVSPSGSGTSVNVIGQCIYICCAVLFKNSFKHILILLLFVPRRMQSKS